MKTNKIRYLFPLLLVALAGRASDDNATRFRATLIGPEETPSIFAESAKGTFTARAVDNDTRIEFTLTWAHLTGNPLFAHVHFGQRHTAGGVSFFLCGGGGKPACAANTTGSATGSVIAADVIGPAPQGIQAGEIAAILKMMRTGFAYANVHTPLHPPGEIRGKSRRAATTRIDGRLATPTLNPSAVALIVDAARDHERGRAFRGRRLRWSGPRALGTPLSAT